MALFQNPEENTYENPIDKKYSTQINQLYTDRYNEVEKRKQEENIFVNNIVSDDLRNEWSKKGQMTAIEVWNKKNKHELMPYAGTLQQGKEAFKLKEISDKMRTGAMVSPEEKKMFEGFVLDMAEAQTRGYTIGGQAMNIGLETIPFLAEFGAGLLTSGGASSLGSAATKLGAKGAIEATKKAVQKTLAEKSIKEIGKDVLVGTAKTAYNSTINPKTIAFTATRLPQQVYARQGEMMLSDSVAVTPDGQVILQEAKDKPAIAFMKALELTNIEVGSEMSGELLVRPFMHGMGRIVGARALKNLAKTKLPEKFVKLAEAVTKLPFVKAVDKLGYNGILEEMGEERVGDLLKFAFNLDEQEGYSFEQFLDAAFPPIEQVAAEAVAFGLTGIGMNAVNSGLKNMSARYDKDGFLLDAGIFRTADRNSLLDSAVKNLLEKNEKTPEEIENVLQFATKDDKLQFLKNEGQSQEEMFKKAQEISNVKNQYFTQMLNAGTEESEANDTAELFAQVIATSAKNFGISIDEANQQFGIKIKGLTPEQAKQQLQNDTLGLDEEEHYQMIDSAGANENEIEEAKKEWQEKGTESKYFKKWFGDSKVVDEDGKPLVVYHGSSENFDIFDRTKTRANMDIQGNFFSPWELDAQGYGSNVRAFYLSIKNPAPSSIAYKALNRFQGQNNAGVKAREYLESLGYDGVNNDNEEYIAFYPEQIKSVDNQGTFDSSNPNIYFQSAWHGSPYNFDEFSTKNIGSGEGAQAHGWGLYFAKNKDTSEGYRNRLSKKLMSLDEEFDKLYINGKPILDNYDIDIRRDLLDTFKTKDKELINEHIKSEIEHWQELANDENYPFREYADKKIKAYSKLLEDLQKEYSLQFTGEGQLYEVDIPDESEMLDEQKYLYEQPKNIQNAVAESFEDVKEKIITEETDIIQGAYMYQNATEEQRKTDEWRSPKLIKENKKELDKIKRVIKHYYNDSLTKSEKEYFDNSKAIQENSYMLTRRKELLDFEFNEWEGKAIYDRLTKLLDSDKEASLLLHKYGIKGIAYDGRADGRAYVVFDDKAIKTIKTYYQSEDESIDNARGFTYNRTNFDGTSKDNLVVLLKGKADKSTLLHEFAHVYLTTLNNLARTNDKAKDMLIKVNKFLRYNGKEYTTAQHEKFANNFVAYVRTGKAPSYGLKKVFENFRKWLSDLYSNLQLTGEVELSQEAVDLFDELLGDMTLEAQKKISDDIIKKARDNAKLIYQNRVAEKNKIEPTQLTDKQKRYKDTAYDIIWYALTHSPEGSGLVKDKKQLYMLLGNEYSDNKRNKGVLNQKEKLIFFLNEVQDPFSANDGFLEEWGEFFSDPGIEDGNDVELVRQALDVIQNKKYLYDSENKYQELSDEDVEIAKLELDYIINNYKDYYDDRDKSVVAFYDWLDEQHPYIQEDLLKDWELRTNEIDRYEALDKFQQAKEDLTIIASKMQHQGDYSAQFPEYAKEILKRLDFMTEKDKEKIFSKLKEFTSFREIVRNLDSVMDYAQTLQDVSDRKQLANQIDSEVRQTIHEWKDGIKRTKYTYPANKLFERLRKINNMKVEEIDSLYDEIVNEEGTPTYIADEVNDESFYETIEKMFVKYKHNGSYYNTTEFLTDLLDQIQKAKFTAKVARDEKDFEIQMQKINLIDECARAVDSHKKDKENWFTKKAENMNAHIMNFNGSLKMIFNDSIKEKFSLDYLYAKKDGIVGADRNEVLEKLREIFGFKNDAQLYSKIIDMTKPIYEIKQRYTPDIESGSVHHTELFDKESGQTKAYVKQITPEGQNRSEWEPEPIKLSKMEILYYYIQNKNPISRKILTDMGDENHPPKGQFDMYEFDQMLDELTPNEKLMGDIIQKAAEKYYDGLNAYHIKKYHTDLGRVLNYFPRATEMEDPKMLDMFNDYTSYNAKDSSQKHRTAFVGVRIKPANALAMLFKHIEKANTIIVMGEQLDLMNRVFNNTNLKKKIEAVFGQNITQAFYQHVTANLYSGQRAVTDLQEQFFAKLANNVIKTQIFAKPQIGLKQVLSFMNYGKGDDYVSALEWTKEFLAQNLTPQKWKENIDFMFDIPFIKDRFTRGGSTDALKRQLESKIFSKMSLLDDIWSIPIKLGDIGAIIWGGKPYIDVLMKKGYSKEQAIKIFIETTVNDQQSSIPSTLSNAQRNAKGKPFATMMFAYQNTPYQYLRSAYTPIITAFQTGKKEDVLKAGKMLFIYGWFFPAIFNVVSSLSIFNLLGGDDDQFKKDLQYALLGLFGMLPITGDFMSAIIYGLNDDKPIDGGDYFASAAKRINKLAREIVQQKITLETMYKAIVAISEIYIGQPVGAIGNSISGAYNITQGEIPKGVLKLLGFSDYRAKVVTGEK